MARRFSRSRRSSRTGASFRSRGRASARRSTRSFSRGRSRGSQQTVRLVIEQPGMGAGMSGAPGVMGVPGVSVPPSGNGRSRF